MKTTSKVFVSAKSDDVLDAVIDANNWPKIFPPCKKVKMECFGDKQRILIQAKSFIKTFNWQSEREVDYSSRRVYFKQLTTVFPVKEMKGYWEVTKQVNGVEVILVHEYKIYGLFGLQSTLLLKLLKYFYVDKNSERELLGLKRYCEGKL
ncbi:SRPBCC family protein [Streptococcus gallolyticus subsp. gallolyticus]|uniref:SRPBCC family protein n=1 Tax=Streptococcus gallolyticus TaxID=315405 RepID=UPI002284413B|nr:SRPBCC family protein [Streptococcus gallolyticus]MCY7172669.1 SRPBCC family protein [Streptococcus gallolyticus subsp. gallolyticus]